MGLFMFVCVYVGGGILHLGRLATQILILQEGSWACIGGLITEGLSLMWTYMYNQGLSLMWVYNRGPVFNVGL